MLQATGLDKFGQFPLLQLAGVVLIVALIAVAVIKGWRAMSQQDKQSDYPKQRWYFDGPLIKALEALEGIYRETKEFRREADEATKERRDQHREHMTAVRELIDRMPTRRR